MRSNLHDRFRIRKLFLVRHDTLRRLSWRAKPIHIWIWMPIWKTFTTICTGYVIVSRYMYLQKLEIKFVLIFCYSVSRNVWLIGCCPWNYSLQFLSNGDTNLHDRFRIRKLFLVRHDTLRRLSWRAKPIHIWIWKIGERVFHDIC
jgi:hypothetical protein